MERDDPGAGVELEEPLNQLIPSDLEHVHASESARLPVSPVALLERDVDGWSALRLAWSLLRALRALNAHDAALELALGEGLDRLLSEFGAKVLGHSRLDDFAHARLGCSGSHVKQLRSLALRLRALPILGRAFLAGDVSSTKLRIVVPVATPETEAGWLARAKALSTRRLQAEVRAFAAAERASRAGADAAPRLEPVDDKQVRVSFSCDSAVAGLLRGYGRAMVRQLVGHPVKDGEVVEALSAEALLVVDDGSPETTTFRRVMVRPVDPDDGASGPAGGAYPPPTTARLIALGGREHRLVRGRPADLGLPNLSKPSNAWALLELLQDLVAERHAVDAERARLLSLARSRGCYRVLGFRTFDDFTQHALGLSPKEVAALTELDDRLLMLPQTRDAWLQGRVSTTVASVLSWVAMADTEAEWLDEAERISLKRLEVEQEYHETWSSVLPRDAYLDKTGGLPQRDAPTSALRLDWRNALKREGHDADSDVGDGLLAVTGRRVRVSFRCSLEVAKLFERALGCVSACHGGAPVIDVDTCLRWMLMHFAGVHASPEHEARWRSHAILERDKYACSTPHCRETTCLHVHHVKERSRGGPLEPWNETTQCEGCHLGVIHEGHVKTVGRAPGALRFHVGADAPGGTREIWSDERLLWKAPRLTRRWRPHAVASR